MDESKAIDVVLKSMDVQQSIIVLMFGALAYIVARDAQGQVTPASRRRIVRLSVFPCGALALLIYGHWALLQSLSTGVVPKFIGRWSFLGEPILDITIALSVIFLGWGLVR